MGLGSPNSVQDPVPCCGLSSSCYTLQAYQTNKIIALNFVWKVPVTCLAGRSESTILGG